MICPEFIELSRLMKEKGIEVRSGEWLWQFEDGSYEISDYLDEDLIDEGHVKAAPAPTIESILTVAFGERVWKSSNPFVKDLGRRVILNKWDIEGNNPLHECPKLCSWLIGQIKNSPAKSGDSK